MDRADALRNVLITCDGKGKEAKRAALDEYVALRSPQEEAGGDPVLSASVGGAPVEWPLSAAVGHLTRATRHLLDAHNCDCMGWEFYATAAGLVEAMAGDREVADALRAALARSPGGTEVCPDCERADAVEVISQPRVRCNRCGHRWRAAPAGAESSPEAGDKYTCESCIVGTTNQKVPVCEHCLNVWRERLKEARKSGPEATDQGEP